MREELISHALAGIAGARDDQVDAAQSHASDAGPAQTPYGRFVLSAAFEGEQDIAALRSLQGDVDALLGTPLRQSQVAQLEAVDACDAARRILRIDRDRAVDERIQPAASSCRCWRR